MLSFAVNVIKSRQSALAHSMVSCQCLVLPALLSCRASSTASSLHMPMRQGSSVCLLMERPTPRHFACCLAAERRVEHRSKWRQRVCGGTRQSGQWHRINHVLVLAEILPEFFLSLVPIRGGGHFGTTHPTSPLVMRRVTSRASRQLTAVLGRSPDLEMSTCQKTTRSMPSRPRFEHPSLPL